MVKQRSQCTQTDEEVPHSTRSDMNLLDQIRRAFTLADQRRQV